MVAFCIQTLLFAVHRHVGSPPINTIETVWKVKTKMIRPRKTAFRFWKNPKLPISSRISSASIITLNNCLAMLFSFQVTWNQALFFSGFFGSRAKKITPCSRENKSQGRSQGEGMIAGYLPGFPLPSRDCLLAWLHTPWGGSRSAQFFGGSTGRSLITSIFSQQLHFAVLPKFWR